MNFRYKLNTIFTFLLLSALVWGQAPAGYYDAAVTKKNAKLKTALHNIIRPHTILEYYSSATYFRQTDWHADGYFWDMYSNNKRTVWSGLNREHNLPKSWWSTNPESTDAYSDLHNLYPSDALANEQKSNYPLGEVQGTPTYSNGLVKVGMNGYSGYQGMVFEPADEYKGDFARDYMYVVTCYEDYENDWRSVGTESMLTKNTYPTLKTYAINLLLKWHRNDPVSEKEINRNNAVYGIQGNRNPFIDFPVLAEYIWGEYTENEWPGDDSEPVDFYIAYNRVTKEIKTPEAISSSQVLYKIYSVDGILRQTGNITADGIIDVKTLEKGVYAVLVYYKGFRLSSKFMIF
jgi:endonuclease I